MAGLVRLALDRYVDIVDKISGTFSYFLSGTVFRICFSNMPLMQHTSFRVHFGFLQHYLVLVTKTLTHTHKLTDRTSIFDNIILLIVILDPRTTEWPLMYSPVPTVIMVLAYLYVVTFLGPRIMTNKKPLKLREILVAYNGFQVLFSVYMLYEVRIKV